MTYFQKLKGHLSTVLAHKRAVFQACVKAGQPWRGFWHDMSKFSPTEFFEYVKYFEVGKSPRDVAIESGHVFTAWRHHVGHNPHHWEYWIDRQQTEIVPLEMPIPHFVEMVCDWIGASKTYATLRGQTWSLEKLHIWYKWVTTHQLFHSATLARVEFIMSRETEEEIYEALRAFQYNDKQK